MAPPRCDAVSHDGQDKGSRNAQLLLGRGRQSGESAQVVPAEVCGPESGADCDRYPGARADGLLEVRSLSPTAVPRPLQLAVAPGRCLCCCGRSLCLHLDAPSADQDICRDKVWSWTHRVFLSRCVAASRYVDLAQEIVVDRYGLWSISAETSRRNSVLTHRDDDELSVASTTASVEGSVRRCPAAWSDAPRSEIEEDACKRRMGNMQGSTVRHRVIGRGNSGVVFLGERTVGDETMQVAVKDVPLPADEDGRKMLVIPKPQTPNPKP